MGIGTTIGVVGGTLAGAGVAAYGANKQANAADQAAQLNYQAQQNALNFQEREFDTQQQNEAPWLQAGQGAVTSLSNMLQNNGFPAWNQQFVPPTAAQASQTPGYQFQLQQGEQALQRSAAAKGGLLSGGTAKALDQYSQGLASENYQQVYNNAFNQYATAYNQFEQNQANQYNRLAGLSGTGQVAAGQLGQEGQAAASNIGNIYQSGSQQIGNNIQNAAYQSASGYNAAAGALGGLSQTALLYNLLKGGVGAGSGSGGPADFSGFSYGG